MATMDHEGWNLDSCETLGAVAGGRDSRDLERRPSWVEAAVVGLNGAFSCLVFIKERSADDA